MFEPFVTEVSPKDSKTMESVDALLASEGLKRDTNLEYTAAILDEEGTVVATGSAFGPTLRCFAVSSSHKGEGLLNIIVSHLIEWEAEKGRLHLFLYTKPSSSLFFSSLGFYEIARTEEVVFMENRRDGFSRFCASIKKSLGGEKCGAIVMNANPFTLGHRYLVEEAKKECDTLLVFVLTEDRSFFPSGVRKRLVEEGVKDIEGVSVLESGDYIISAATFPTYFLKEEVVGGSHGRLDAVVFSRIAGECGIKVRFLGSEPFDTVTSSYNEALLSELPERNVDVRVIERKSVGGEAISASRVRSLFQKGETDALKALVPKSTLEYLISEEGKSLIK